MSTKRSFLLAVASAVTVVGLGCAGLQTNRNFAIVLGMMILFPGHLLAVLLSSLNPPEALSWVVLFGGSFAFYAIVSYAVVRIIDNKGNAP
jgi:FtsH-binding integral membrane protein